MAHCFRKTTTDRCPLIFFLQFRVWWLIITYSLIFPGIGNDDPHFQVCLRVYNFKEVIWKLFKDPVILNKRKTLQLIGSFYWQGFCFSTGSYFADFTLWLAVCLPSRLRRACRSRPTQTHTAQTSTTPEVSREGEVEKTSISICSEIDLPLNLISHDPGL